MHLFSLNVLFILIIDRFGQFETDIYL